MENLEQWSDEQILATCMRYGEEARKWKNRFLGLLPEVERRKLYLQKGFSSIFHFAQVLGGVSEEQVRNVVRLEKRFQKTPALHHLLVHGEVSIHKMERVAFIAEPDNEIFLADQVQMLSKTALDTLVRDAKYAEVKSLDVQTSALSTMEETMQVAVELDAEVADRLIAMRNKGIDINKLLDELLDTYHEEIQQTKEQIGESCKETESRYIPQAVRDILAKEYGTKCSIDGCERHSEEIHHTQRFSLAKRHDPRYMALLCHEHHQIAHSKDVRVQEIRAKVRKRE